MTAKLENKLKRKNKPGAGRPPKPIEKDLVIKLASRGCNADIIADCVGIDVRTIERKYAGIIKEGRGKLKNNLLAALYDKAVNKGDTTCLIWLSKQYLGFKEPKQEVEQTNTTPYTVQIIDYAANPKKCKQT